MLLAIARLQILFKTFFRHLALLFFLMMDFYEYFTIWKANKMSALIIVHVWKVNKKSALNKNWLLTVWLFRTRHLVLLHSIESQNNVPLHWINYIALHHAQYSRCHPYIGKNFLKLSKNIFKEMLVTRWVFIMECSSLPKTKIMINLEAEIVL